MIVLLIVGLAVSVGVVLAVRLRRLGPGVAPRRLAFLAAGLVLCDAFLYVGILASQVGEPEWWRIAIVSTLVAVLGLAVVAGGLRVATWAGGPLLAIGSAGLLGLGFIAAFSIGLPLLAAGALASVATWQTLLDGPGGRAPRLLALGGVALGLLLLSAGFALVDRLPPSCPSKVGHLEGSVSSSGHTTHFVCEGGRLVSSWRD